jgi:hypothetical protein
LIRAAELSKVALSRRLAAPLVRPTVFKAKRYSFLAALAAVCALGVSAHGADAPDVSVSASSPDARDAPDGDWITRRLPWYKLPSRETLGAAPIAAPVSELPWSLAAASDRIDAFAGYGTVILRVNVLVESGTVGLSMMNLTGSTLLSKEKVLTAKDGPQAVYFRVEPQGGARILVLRNPGAGGESGIADVQSVQMAREQTLSADEMARANLGML